MLSWTTVAGEEWKEGLIDWGRVRTRSGSQTPKSAPPSAFFPPRLRRDTHMATRARPAHMVTLLGALVRASGVPCVARCASASGLAAVPSCSWQSEWRCLHSSTAAAQRQEIQKRQKSKRMRTAYNFWQSDEHKPRDDKSGDVVPWRDLSASLKKRYTQRVEQSKSSAETLQTILNTISLLDATRGTLATKVASEGTNGKRNRQQTARTAAKAARAWLPPRAAAQTLRHVIPS